MTTHPQPPKESSKDFTPALASMGILMLWTIPEIITMFLNDAFITRLSPALPDGVPVAALEPWNIAIYLTAMVVKFLALAIVTYAIVKAVRPMIKGEVFMLANARWLKTATWAVVVWFIARFGIEGLGNNFAASTLEIDSWSGSTSGTPLSDAAPAFLLVIVLGLMSAVIRRGVPLRDEVDGLV